MKPTGPRVLVAGIGNVFKGDDAFGVEVIRYLRANYHIPQETLVADFGIRGYDLAFALGDGYEAAILIDAAPRQTSPGSLCLLQLDANNLAEIPPGATSDGHSLDPLSVLRLVRALGETAAPNVIYLLGCEPAVVDREDGAMALSPPVAAAVPKAAEMICSHLEKQFGIHLDPPPQLTRPERGHILIRRRTIK